MDLPFHAVTRVRPVDEHPELVEAVIDRIGGPALDLSDDPDVALVAVADSEPHGVGPGVGLLARRADTWELAVALDDDTAVLADVVAALCASAAAAGGGPVRWFVPDATARHARVAADAGLAPTRRLFQMRGALPLPERSTVLVRPYEPDRDRTAWMAVNNRAFDWHPDQGGWTERDVRERELEDWFDPAGFLLHEVDGRLAAFCWTKVHGDHEPPLGEIYVIAVDPEFQGRGLGRELTLAGLEHLAEQGLQVGMLYVEDDNVAAVGLYRRLGFRIHHEDVFFTGTIA